MLMEQCVYLRFLVILGVIAFIGCTETKPSVAGNPAMTKAEARKQKELEDLKEAAAIAKKKIAKQELEQKRKAPVTTPPLVGGHASLDAAAKSVISKLLDGTRAEFQAELISKEEYITKVHDHLPESASMTGEVKWKTFTQFRRSDAVDTKFATYNKQGFRFVKLGQAEGVFTHGSLKVHRKIPVHFERANAQPKPGSKVETLVDNSILGVVIEKDGIFKLYNVFRD